MIRYRQEAIYSFYQTIQVYYNKQIIRITIGSYFIQTFRLVVKMVVEFGCRGAIVRIRLHNFMTYSDTVLHPGPNLNMILGPNGTGKSAIVCCIIVGLAGEVNLTGRGSSPADFVKRNTNEGSTEIELYNERGKNYVVERKIIITGRSSTKIDHKSEWKINGKQVNKTDVKTLTSKLDIKVDNLCQFLPQDSVTQFVKMNNKELLLNTLKASGDSKLVDDLQKLVEYSKEVEEKRIALDDLKKSCEENETNARRLETEVAQLRQRDELKKQRLDYATKLYYTMYQNAKKKVKKNRDERGAFAEKLENLNRDTEPFKQAAAHYQNEKNRLNLTLDRSIKVSEEAERSVDEIQRNIQERKLDAQREFAKFRGKEEEEKSRSETIKRKKQELESLENRLNECRDVDCSGQITSVEGELSHLKQNRIECRRQMSQKEDVLRTLVRDLDNLKRERDHMMAIREKKIGLLRVKFPEAFRVVEWLSVPTNREKFQKPICLPLMCEINVKEAKHNKFVEHVIGRQDLSAFVCQTTADVRTFTRIVREQLKVKVNIILAPERSYESFEAEGKSWEESLPRCSAKYIFLKDLIDAPEPIMRYLCASNFFHKIPLIEDCTESELKSLFSMFGKFFHVNTFYTTSKSRYDNQQMTVSDTVREPQHLIYSLDVRGLKICNERLVRLQEDQAKTTQERDELLKKDDQYKIDWQRASDRLCELKRKQDQKRYLESQIKITYESLTELEKTRIDIRAERGRLQHSVTKINDESLVLLTKLSEIYKKSLTSKETLLQNSLMALIARRNAKIAEHKCNQTQQESSRLKIEITKKDAEHDILNNELEERKEKAQEKIPSFRNGILDKATKRMLESLSETTEEDIKGKIMELKLQMQRIYKDKDDGVMRDFNRQNEQVKDKRLRINIIEEKLNKLASLQDDIKQNWLPSVQNVLEIIDINYQAFMRKLSYDGQVRLDFKPDDPDDFAAYGISILVKYRDEEQLIPLTSARQSGGERSVATMIYMLALQTKTTVPFRCVDEINQGMDKDNERKVFELLVKTADTSSSQYFLVSPKLLPNLPYSAKMKIHVVFNGEKLNLSWAEELTN